MNCAAIPAHLLESQLFGHRKGAFTGADADHEGFFQQADSGTLFLDEVGELSLECQAKLLRVLETKRFTPLGGKGEIAVNVRFLAATHRPLEEQIKETRFRQDLYFRLNVVEIVVPPLRDHPEDIPALVDYFLDQLAIRCRRHVQLTPAALERLQNYSWPGNIRQLQYTLESAIVLAESDTIDCRDLRLRDEAVAQSPVSLNLQDLESWAIHEALRRTGNQVKEAARLLGIARSTLYSKAEKYGLKLDQ
jgi:transcriptional regulator with PAS, ATPase and Fis domain